MSNGEIVNEQILTPQLAPPLAGALAPSPYNFEFTTADALRLTVHNSQTGAVIAVHYRILTRDQGIHATVYQFGATADRLATAAEFVIGEGYLLNVTVFASAGSPRRGQTFVRLQVIRGRGEAATVLGTLVQGYVTGNQDRAWPGSPLEGSLEGDGYVRLVQGGDPAGPEARDAVPTGARWELLSWQAVIFTDASGISRHINLTYDDGTVVYVRVTNPASIGPSKSSTIGFAQGLPLETVILGENNMGGLPRTLVLLAGHRISTLTSNVSLGDNYAQPQMLVREWLEAQ